MCSCKRVPGRRPKFYSPLRGKGRASGAVVFGKSREMGILKVICKEIFTHHIVSLQFYYASLCYDQMKQKSEKNYIE